MSFLDVKHIKKVYTQRLGAKETVALKNVNFLLEKGEFVSVMGESGSGKTILYKMVSLLGRITHPQLLLSIGAVIASFATIYGIIYMITSKVYLSIVE